MEVVDRIVQVVDQVTFDYTNCCSHLETCLQGFLTGQAKARYLYLGFVQLHLPRNLQLSSR